MQKSVELNIELNVKDSLGQTAFLMACKNGHTKLVEMLLQKSAELNMNFNADTRNGLTPFHYVCSNGHTKIAEIFMQNSALLEIDPNTKDNDLGRTAFHHACIN